MDKLVRAGEQVLVHCNGGRHRSPAVCAAYLVWARKRSLAQAVEMVDPTYRLFIEAVAREFPALPKARPRRPNEPLGPRLKP